MDSYVSASNVSVAFGPDTLLAPVSFDLEAAQALAVVGSNGSGKTTLLRVLAGLTPASGGIVTVRGEPPNDRSPRFRGQVAALLGSPPLARNLTLREHLVLVGTSWGYTVEDSSDRAEALLRDFGITRLRSRFPHELSSGQAQLFALALTLSRPFEMLILDEPEQRLDPDRLTLVGNLLSSLIDRGVTLVMASHSRSLVEHVTDRVVNISEAVNDDRH
ncbi:ATP-binding cassette domain-containing protein [Nesterenkonia halotolerans]|uniref:ABC transporter ATP-binding protein n=1 Tax=Nesterenkonia halotolerans TaxID=225325 RepID=UPI003EE73859